MAVYVQPISAEQASSTSDHTAAGQPLLETAPLVHAVGSTAGSLWPSATRQGEVDDFARKERGTSGMVRIGRLQRRHRDPGGVRRAGPRFSQVDQPRPRRNGVRCVLLERTGRGRRIKLHGGHRGGGIFGRPGRRWDCRVWCPLSRDRCSRWRVCARAVQCGEWRLRRSGRESYCWFATHRSRSRQASGSERGRQHQLIWREHHLAGDARGAGGREPLEHRGAK